MAKITIIRSNGWINSVATNNIYIDGIKVGIAYPGKSFHFETSPGKHLVKAKSGPTGNSKTIEVDLDEGECKTIKLASNKYLNMSGVFLPLIAALIQYLLSTIFSLDIKFMYIAVGLLFLYLLNFLTFGRDMYWKLKEVEEGTGLAKDLARN